MLIKNKADTNAKDNVGRKPLQVLALQGIDLISISSRSHLDLISISPRSHLDVHFFAGDYNVTITAPPQAPLGIELARFIETGEFSDISFLVGGEEFKAHKLILCVQV